MKLKILLLLFISSFLFNCENGDFCLGAEDGTIIMMSNTCGYLIAIEDGTFLQVQLFDEVDKDFQLGDEIRFSYREVDRAMPSICMGKTIEIRCVVD